MEMNQKQINEILKNKILESGYVAAFRYLREYLPFTEYSIKNIKMYLDIFCKLNNIEYNTDEKHYMMKG